MVHRARCAQFCFACVKFAGTFGCTSRDIRQALAYISLVFSEEVSGGCKHWESLAWSLHLRPWNLELSGMCSIVVQIYVPFPLYRQLD